MSQKRRWLNLAACMLLCAAEMASAASERIVYGDGLSSGFENWSWASSHFAQTGVVHGGSQAISFEPDAWAGLFVHASAPIGFAEHTALRLYVRGAAPGAQQLTLSFQLGQATVWEMDANSVIAGGSVSATEWRVVNIAFSGAPASQFDGLILSDRSGGNQTAVYVDDIALTEGAPPPPPTPVALSVDVQSNRRVIDPMIYGVNFGSNAQHARLRYPTRRWGGNSTTRYNWQFDVHNTAGDWFYQNIGDGNGNNLPAVSTANAFVTSTRAQGGDPLITLPTIGWVPRDDRSKRWSFSILKYGAQTQNECSYFGSDPANWPSWCSADAGNGLCTSGTHCSNGRIVGNDPADTSQAVGADYAANWVSHLRSQHGAGVVTLFALDNEAMLWNSTHRDLHPAAPTFDEVWSKGRDVALVVKAIEPQAKIFGPVTWGWCDYFSSAADAVLGNCYDGPDRQAHGGMPFVEWYLQQVCAVQQSSGVRPVDYLDLHYYPQGDGVDGLDNDTSYGESPDVAARRLRSLRELYDPSWNAESWIGGTSEPNPYLLRRARAAIDARCPGVKLALTEYKWGPDDGLTGALAQAELLAIFGREGVDYATRWVAPEDNTLAEQAFKMFLNFDGQFTRLTGHSVAATSTDENNLGVYAIDGGNDRLYVLVFNRSLLSREVQLDLGSLQASSMDHYRLDGSGLQTLATGVAANGSQLTLGTQPAHTADLWVITAPNAGVWNGFASGFEDGR